MAFTDRCDVFAAVHEEGINRLIAHLMQKRPSLFNYGTDFVAQNIELVDQGPVYVAQNRGETHVLCAPITVARDVVLRQNPIIKRVDPLPVLGASPAIGVNFCAQVTRLAIDFHPGSAIQLPSELAPLPAQRFALSGSASVGLGCPEDEEILRWLRKIGLEPALRRRPSRIDDRERDPVLGAESMICVDLSLFVVGHFDLVMRADAQGRPQPRLKARVDGIEVVDIGPASLEAALECYLNMVVQLTLLPQLNEAIPPLLFDLTNVIPLTQLPFTVKPTPLSPPAPAGVPANPAIEEDQLKAFITLEKQQP